MVAEAAFRAASVASGTIKRPFVSRTHEGSEGGGQPSGAPHFVISKAPPPGQGRLVNVRKVFCQNRFRGSQWGWRGVGGQEAPVAAVRGPASRRMAASKRPRRAARQPPGAGRDATSPRSELQPRARAPFKDCLLTCFLRF